MMMDEKKDKRKTTRSILDFVKEIKTPLALTAILLVIGTIIYAGPGEQITPSLRIPSLRVPILRPADTKIYDDISLKALSTEDGFKIVALASNNILSKYRASEGNPIPEKETMVVGSKEAAAIRTKGKMTKINSPIEGLPGLRPRAGGVLAPTGGPIDHMYMASHMQYDTIKGDEGKIFIRADKKGKLKIFYLYRQKQDPDMKIALKEGDIQNYKPYEIAGEKYFPVIIGTSEAETMREEGTYNKPGDVIRDFFGQNAVIIGVMAKTGTVLDTMHIMMTIPAK